MRIVKEFKIDKNFEITGIYTVFKQRFDSNYFFDGETHDFWECVYVRKGNVCVSGDERVYHMHNGDMIFHKPLELHKYYVETLSGADLFIFSFTMSGELSNYFEKKVFSLSAPQSMQIDELIRFAAAAHSPIDSDELSSMFSPCLYSNTYLQQLSAMIERLFLCIYDDANISYAAELPDETAFKNAVRYMTSHIDGQLTIGELAKYCNISPSGLKRLFNRYAGLGIHKYFLKLKINKAARYLKSGVKVTEISELLGFSSQGYFSNVFKRETGFNPSEYASVTVPIE